VVAPRRFPYLALLAAALAMVAAAAVTWFVARRPMPAARMEFALAVPEEMSISHMALSRDGSMLVFVTPDETSALPILFVQRVGSPNVTPLKGTEGASYPFWSPDGTYVGFFANGKLQKIAIAGGEPQVLATALAGRGGSWGSTLPTPKARSSALMPMGRELRRSPGTSEPRRINRTAGRSFSPTATISYSGAGILPTSRMTARAAST